MREIKFRGKQVNNGEWIYGSLVNDKFAKTYYIYPFINDDDDLIGAAVIPETIGQYTGYKDKNGNDIYEDDIIKNQYGDHGYISMNTDYWEINWNCKNYARNLKVWASDIQVVGNRSDNK